MNWRTPSYPPEPYVNDYERRKMAEVEAVGRSVERAVAEAIAGVPADRVVVINLTVQYASGGGATNIVGQDPA